MRLKYIMKLLMEREHRATISVGLKRDSMYLIELIIDRTSQVGLFLMKLNERLLPVKGAYLLRSRTKSFFKLLQRKYIQTLHSTN
jgi:hypothetical protein